MCGPIMSVAWWLLYSAASSPQWPVHLTIEMSWSRTQDIWLRCCWGPWSTCWASRLASIINYFLLFILNLTVPVISLWTPGNKYCRESAFPFNPRFPRIWGEHLRSPRESYTVTEGKISERISSSRTLGQTPSASRKHCSSVFACSSCCLSFLVLLVIFIFNFATSPMEMHLVLCMPGKN